MDAPDTIVDAVDCSVRVVGRAARVNRVEALEADAEMKSLDASRAPVPQSNYGGLITRQFSWRRA